MLEQNQVATPANVNTGGSVGPIAAGASVDLEHLAEENTDGIVVFDSAGTYLFVNLEAERMLARPRTVLLGRTVWDVFPATAAEGTAFGEHFRKAVDERIAASYDTFFAPISRWLQVRLVPCSGHKSVSGDQRGVSVYFRDITRRIEAQQQRAEFARRFRLMANSAPVLIWTSDLDAKYDWFNEPWLAFTGRTTEQEVGDGWTEGVHPEDLDQCLKTYHDAFAVREKFTREYRQRRHDGVYRWLLDTGVPLLTEDGSFQGYIGSCVDITEQRSAVESQRKFVQEMMASVTEGRLRLCGSAGDLPPRAQPAAAPVELTPSTLRHLRAKAASVAEDLHLSIERAHDLLTAVGEAAMNAVKHGGGGTGHVHADIGRGMIQVWITDKGKGIRDEDLHRATLEQGWSGANSFGHGFHLMLRTVDRTFLLTSPDGTTIVLEQETLPPQPAWL